jgi:hypothetical protein
MANTYSNSVIIGASRQQVEHYLIDTGIGDFRFNMAKLFPEQFPASDTTGDETWTSAWCCDHTGSPTLPSVALKDR